MGPSEYYELGHILAECEVNPDKTLFLFNEAETYEPYYKIPLGESPTEDGYLMLHEDGWFIYKQEK